MSWFKRKAADAAPHPAPGPPQQGLAAAVAALSSPSELEVSRAAHELGGSGDPRAVAPLVARLTEPGTGAFVGMSIIRALGALGDEQGITPTLDALDRLWPELLELRGDRFESMIDGAAEALESMAGATGPVQARAFTAVWHNRWHDVMELGEHALPALRRRIDRSIATADTSQLDRLVPRLGQLRSDALVETIVAAASAGATVDPCVLALLDIGSTEAIGAVLRLPLGMFGTHVHGSTMLRHFEDLGRRVAAADDADAITALERLLEDAGHTPFRFLTLCARTALQAAGVDLPDPEPVPAPPSETVITGAAPTKAEAADRLLRQIFAQPSSDRWERMAPERVLGAWAEQLVAASGYDEIDAEDRVYDVGFSGAEHETEYTYGTQRGEAAVRFLCDHPLPASTNVLHLVAAKPDVRVVSASPSFGEDSYITLSFEGQRALAATELARRGNPPYDPAGYDTLPEAPPPPPPFPPAPKPLPEVMAMLDLLIEDHRLTFSDARFEGTVTHVPLWSADALQAACGDLVAMGAIPITDPAPTAERILVRCADGTMELFVRHDTTPIPP